METYLGQFYSLYTTDFPEFENNIVATFAEDTAVLDRQLRSYKLLEQISRLKVNQIQLNKEWCMNQNPLTSTSSMDVLNTF